MERLPPLSQVAKVASLLVLFLLAPFVPLSLRTPYVYFLFNAVVIAVGVEAGLLAAITSGPRADDKKPTAAASEAVVTPNSTHFATASTATSLAKPVDTETPKKMKKCPSRASIFFIGTFDGEEEGVEEEEEEEAMGGHVDAMMTKQELFAKAEAFIGNFYRQLRMQREDSWKKLHDLYHHHHHYKAF